jgi:hypothetical protein
MKANVLLSGTLALAVLSACAPKTPPPAPVAPARPIQTAQPILRPPPPAGTDWRDAPLTAGSWRWSGSDGRSTASFGLTGQPPLVTITCLTRGTIQLTHAGTVSAATPLIVTTGSEIFPLMSDPPVPGATGITVTLPARAPVLDAMAFSRGRFVIEVARQMPGYLPAWPELSRVVEDCR